MIALLVSIWLFDFCAIDLRIALCSVPLVNHINNCLALSQLLSVCYLQVTSPGSLPQIFKNALSAPLLVDIIKCIATFFM